MHSITFELETITPMFMYGADQNHAELRPPSFKGMMRFWWRAMRADDDVKTLSKDEAHLFGGTDKGQGRSKIIVRFLSYEISQILAPLLPHDLKRMPQRKAIKPDYHFTCNVTLTTTSENEKQELVAAFKCALLLGGMGKRSRRGYGSVSYRAFETIPQFIEELVTSSQSLSKIPFDQKNLPNAICLKKRTLNEKEPEYPRILEIFVGTKGLGRDVLLKKIGEASHTHTNPALGTVANKKRFASPVIVTVVKTAQAYHPVITKLTTHFPDGVTGNLQKQQDFINEVLQ
ncbi:CRISPR-associated RAMP protein, Cmr1 family [Candidatus Moduliflexus flocculans]|uniref:CRISPR-associated RAMP protein, Cmr1 family n=1 Tax=Candidatus Moduliflexus flocculans TaxID=1499966 RepID=A0A081BLE6_9BACT|nr:CRISPR-associated RAMP protein, Cmr1 family [Candidatus Moduliflexus flocculans]